MLPLRDNIPLARFPIVTVALVAANAFAYLLAVARHTSFLQFLLDIVFLAIFGPTVEDALGRVRFPLLYALGGLLALACQLLAHPDSSPPVLGTGGAVAAVLGAYIVMYPRARVLGVVPVVFSFTIIAVPVTAMIGVWVVLQLCFAFLGGASTGAAALLGAACSFAFGLLGIRPLLSRGRTEQPLSVS